MSLYPKKLSSYEIIEENIGSGGFAVVHKAKCNKGIVALKVPKDSGLSVTFSLDSSEKFKQEAILWRSTSMRHGNISSKDNFDEIDPVNYYFAKNKHWIRSFTHLSPLNVLLSKRHWMFIITMECGS